VTGLVTPTTEVVMSVAASVVAGVVMIIGRQIVKTLRATVVSMTALQAFTVAWSKAAGLEETIRANAAKGIEAQAELDALSRYVHSWRHDDANIQAALQKIAEAMAVFTSTLARLVSSVETLINQHEGANQ
jgi:oligoribonuclease (3'-5' exoribonuclease)